MAPFMGYPVRDHWQGGANFFFEKKGGENSFLEKKGEEFFGERIGDFFTKESRQISPKIRPKYPVNFYRPLDTVIPSYLRYEMKAEN